MISSVVTRSSHSAPWAQSTLGTQGLLVSLPSSFLCQAFELSLVLQCPIAFPCPHTFSHIVPLFFHVSIVNSFFLWALTGTPSSYGLCLRPHALLQEAWQAFLCSQRTCPPCGKSHFVRAFSFYFFFYFVNLKGRETDRDREHAHPKANLPNAPNNWYWARQKPDPFPISCVSSIRL